MSAAVILTSTGGEKSAREENTDWKKNVPFLYDEFAKHYALTSFEFQMANESVQSSWYWIAIVDYKIYTQRKTETEREKENEREYEIEKEG